MNMVWHVLLAHFLADYPLQIPWILRHKRQTWAVAVHAGFHLVIMLLLVGVERGRLWPYLAVLAGVHFLIDLGKNLVYKLRPRWVIAPYVVDQSIHYLAIWLIFVWIEAAVGATQPPFDPQWALLATSYLVVMYVWHISERIMVYSSPSYQAEVQAHFWPRMLTRSGLLTLLLVVSGLPSTFSLVAISASLLPYISGKHRLRAFLTDSAVACAIWLFIRSASG